MEGLGYSYTKKKKRITTSKVYDFLKVSKKKSADFKSCLVLIRKKKVRLASQTVSFVVNFFIDVWKVVKTFKLLMRHDFFIFFVFQICN